MAFVLLVIGLSCFFLDAESQAGPNCLTDSSCADAEDLVFDNNFVVRCHGDHSCFNSGGVVSGGGADIECFGAYSCYGVNRHYVEKDACDGLFSCFDTGDIFCDSLSCNGGQSCSESRLQTAKQFDINCNGDRSCQDVQFEKMLSDNDLSGFGYLSIAGGEVRDFTNIYCYGAKSCQNLNVICENGDGCTIECLGGNSCDGIRITGNTNSVKDENGNVFVYPYSRTGFHQDFVDKFPFLDVNIMYPDPSSFDASTKGNSDSICNSNEFGSRIECGDTKQCSNKNITQRNKNPICCSGYESCSKSNLEHLPNNNNIISSASISSIRCDGRRSCWASDITTNGNRGNIYLSGCESGYASKIEAMNGDIIVEGKEGGLLSTIVGGNNIYVTGENGLFSSEIDIINNNVYYLSYWGGFMAKHNIIGGVLYCLAHSACLFIQVNDVENVVCEGVGSCAAAGFDSIRNGLFALGDESLNGARITANKVEGDGEFILYVDGDMTSTYYLTCKSDIICFVLCKTEDACKDLIITRESSTSIVHFFCGSGVNCKQPQIIDPPNPTPGNCNEIGVIMIFFLFCFCCCFYFLAHNLCTKKWFKNMNDKNKINKNKLHRSKVSSYIVQWIFRRWIKLGSI